MLIDVNAPYSIIERKSFIDVFPGVCRDRRTLITKFNEMYEITKRNIKTYLSNQDSINIYADEWSRFNLNFVGVFCSTPGKDALLAYGIPDPITRTAEDLKTYIFQQISFYGIQNRINFCSTDSAKNIVKAITGLNISWNPCACHILNKAAEKAMEPISEISNITQVVSMISKSTKFKQFMLFINSKFYTIPLYSRTRWLSMGAMFHRLSTGKNDIQNFFNSEFNINNLHFSINEWLFIDDMDEIFSKINMTIQKLEANGKTGFFNVLCILLETMLYI